jgi:periplasmic divalent cation tolerance protein
MTDVRIVLTTIDNADAAARLARTLVELRLAACVNLVDTASVYRWQGKVESAEEILLVIKTSTERISELKDRLPQLHPYDVPELIVLPVTDGAASYLAWVLAACGARE